MPPPPGHAQPAPPPMHYGQSVHPGYPPPAAYDLRAAYPPPGSYAPGYYSPPVLQAAPSYVLSPADFKRERPEVYGAFEQMSIHALRDGGTEVRLPDGMCRDRHVPDFLQCLRCWLWHHQGDPRSSGRPWRIRCLDISGNGLTDASASHVFEQLQSLDLRIERLCLNGNGIEARGLEKIIDYLWNCPDPLLELDLANNQVEAQHSAGSFSDPVSALMRCIYNHPAYPQIVAGQSGKVKVVPVTIRLGGNKVKEPARLLKAVEAKVGKKRVQIRPSPDPYEHKGDEFIAVCLPEFLDQATLSSRERTRKRRRRSRSGHTHKRVHLKAGPGAAKSLEVESKPVKIEKAVKIETNSKLKKEKKEKKSKRPAAASPHKDEEPEHWCPATQDQSESGGSAASGADGKEKHHRNGSGEARDTSRKKAPALLIPESEQKSLQEEIKRKLGKTSTLPNEDSSREMLSEFVVCMAVAGRAAKEIEKELVPFLADESKHFVKWFGKHIQRYRKS